MTSKRSREYMKDREVSFIGFLLCIRTSDFASAAKIVTPQPPVAALLGLHRVVACNNKVVRNEYDLFLKLNIERYDGVVHRFSGGQIRNGYMCDS